MEALAIPLRAGRLLDARDTEGAPRVALISESAARRYWPGENPVGKRLRVHVNETIKEPRQIVGVVGDVRIRNMAIEPVPVIYLPHTQYDPEFMTIAAHTAGEPLALPCWKVGPVRPSATSTMSHAAPEPRLHVRLRPRSLALSVFTASLREPAPAFSACGVGATRLVLRLVLAKA